MAHECHRPTSAITLIDIIGLRPSAPAEWHDSIWRVSEIVNGKKTNNLKMI